MKPARGRRPTRSRLLAIHLAFACAIACAGACQQAAADEADETDAAKLVLPDVSWETAPDRESAAWESPSPTTTPDRTRYDVISRRRRGESDSHYHRVVARPARVNLLLLTGGLFAVLMLISIRRRRAATPAPPPAPIRASGRGRAGVHVAGGPRTIMAVACDRCSRVVNVPRDRLARGVFCPRCGSRIAGDV